MSLAEAQHDRASPRWPVMLLILLALGISVTIGVLKINALVAWRYTSDLFTVDTMLAETLRGNFMMEFAYGRQFGDHACLIFLALVPVKWVLGTKMVFLLVLLPAIAFAVCGTILFKCVRDIVGGRWAALAAVIYFLSVGAFRGPFEHVFGFHIDALSGYVAVAMAALFLRHAQTGRGAASALIAACVFALLKEEMALLGVIFFTSLLLLGLRTRVHAIGLLICLILFALELWITRIARTPWNRSNEALVGIFFGALRHYGVIGFFFSSNKIEYWSNVLGILAIYAACVALPRRLNLFAAALVITGLAKLTFAWFIPDFYPWTWHNYPALVMLTGGVVLQAIELRHVPQHVPIATGALVAISLGVFAVREVPYALSQARETADVRVATDRVRHAMLDVIRHVDPRQVATVPKYSAYEWAHAGHRYTFFPKGVTGSPHGIADALVTRRRKDQPDGPETTAFTLIYQNGHFRLWRRSGYHAHEEHSRGLFIEMFGRDAIGLGPEPTKKKPPKKKKRRPATTAVTRQD